MSRVVGQSAKDKGESKLRKIFYFDNDKDKPILASGVLFIKESPDGKKDVLVQKVKKEDGKIIVTDFGGKVDLDDTTPIQAAARELGEEINYGIFHKDKGSFLDEEGLKRLIQGNIMGKVYLPTAKYFLVFVKFNDKEIGIDMEKIGDHETLDQIERTVDWISSDDFIKTYFDQKLHPRLWSKQVLNFFGYEGPEISVVKSKPIVLKKFGFKSL